MPRVEKEDEDFRYENGKIYRLVFENLVYVGSTFLKLNIRFSKHKSNYKSFCSGKIKYRCASTVLFEKGEVEIILIEDFPCKNKDELEIREEYWRQIEMTKKGIICVNEKKCFQTTEEILEYQKEYYEQNREKFLEQRKEYQKKNRDEISQQKKEWYEKNKDEILQKRKEKVCCPFCKKEITKQHLLRHQRNTKKCLTIQQQQNI